MDGLVDALRNPLVRVISTPVLILAVLLLVGATTFGISAPSTILALPVAIAATPQFWLGGFLAHRALRYLRSSERVLPPFDERERNDVALTHLRELHATREWLAKRSRSSVFVGYALLARFTQREIDRGTLNFHSDAIEEWEEIRRYRSRQTMFTICRYVTTSSSFAPPSEKAGALEAMVDALSDQETIRGIVVATHGDGPGILTTVNCASLVHYLTTRSVRFQNMTEEVLAELQLDSKTLGWLSTRVLEAVLVLLTKAQRTPEEIAASVLAISQNATESLRNRRSSAEARDVKWNARASLLLLTEEAGYVSR